MNKKEQLQICTVQFNIQWENKELNYGIIERLLNKLEGHPDVIIFPEMFTTGFTMNTATQSETMDGTTVNRMKKISRELKCIICGSIIVKEKNKYYNRFVACLPDQTIISYDKRHLFRMADENKYFSAGEEISIINYCGWRIAPFVCYDLRFPVWMRNKNNYDLAIIVANWPEKRDDVWQTLLKARALENQCYVAGVNRYGTDGNDVDHCGNSMVVSPKGVVLNQMSSGDQTFTVSLSMNELNYFRKKFPVHLDADDFKIDK